MLLQTPIRLPSQPLQGAEAVQLRRDSSEQRQAEARGLGGRQRATISDQAAVVHFGSQALGLARSQPPPAEASLSAPDDTEEPAVAARPGAVATATAVAGTARAGSAAPATAAAAVSGTAVTAAAATASAVTTGAGTAVASASAALQSSTAPDTATGSPAREAGGAAENAAAPDDSTASAGADAAAAGSGASTSTNSRAVDSEEQAKIDAMKRRDREVRTHEQAHKAAGGSFTGGVRLTYQMGSDGKRYAVEGEVPIDVSPVAGDPAATLRKMEVVMRAARAPASPSGADQAVAAQAARAMQQARAQLAAERYTQARELLPGA